MESKGEVYQGGDESSQGVVPQQVPENLASGQSQYTDPQTNMMKDENEAVNRLFSLGLVLLAASVIITIFYLFSVSEFVENLSFELPEIELPF